MSPLVWFADGLDVVGLELGGVASAGACRGVASSDEWEMGVRFPDEKELDVGGCKVEAARADWQTDGAVNAD